MVRALEKYTTILRENMHFIKERIAFISTQQMFYQDTIFTI